MVVLGLVCFSLNYMGMCGMECVQQQQHSLFSQASWGRRGMECVLYKNSSVAVPNTWSEIYKGNALEVEKNNNIFIVN